MIGQLLTLIFYYRASNHNNGGRVTIYRHRLPSYVIWSYPFDDGISVIFVLTNGLYCIVAFHPSNDLRDYVGLVALIQSNGGKQALFSLSVLLFDSAVPEEKHGSCVTTTARGRNRQRRLCRGLYVGDSGSTFSTRRRGDKLRKTKHDLL